MPPLTISLGGYIRERTVNRYDFTPWESPITQVAGLLVAGTNEHDLVPMGTAFFAAPYLALTARHVVDEIFLRFQGCLPWDARGDLRFGLHFGHFYPGFGLLKWDVIDYGISQSIDVVALIVEPERNLPPGFAWHLPRFAVLPPPLGSQLAAFGYPRSTHRLDDVGGAKIGIDPHTATGTVLEVHPRYRDTSMLPFPCLYTDARFDPGMSGGPVFNEDGRICGLVSSNLPPAVPGERHSSYVSLIWPALGLGLSINVSPSREPTERYHLKRLADDGRMQVLDIDLVKAEAKDGSDHLILGPRALNGGTTKTA
jgi:hypothetical protein